MIYPKKSIFYDGWKSIARTVVYKDAKAFGIRYSFGNWKHQTGGGGTPTEEVEVRKWIGLLVSEDPVYAASVPAGKTLRF